MKKPIRVTNKPFFFWLTHLCRPIFFYSPPVSSFFCQHCVRMSFVHFFRAYVYVYISNKKIVITKMKKQKKYIQLFFVFNMGAYIYINIKKKTQIHIRINLLSSFWGPFVVSFLTIYPSKSHFLCYCIRHFSHVRYDS